MDLAQSNMASNNCTGGGFGGKIPCARVWMVEDVGFKEQARQALNFTVY